VATVNLGTVNQMLNALLRTADALATRALIGGKCMTEARWDLGLALSFPLSLFPLSLVPPSGGRMDGIARQPYSSETSSGSLCLGKNVPSSRPLIGSPFTTSQPHLPLVPRQMHH